MSRFAPMPVRAVRRLTQPALVSASRFRWQARRGALDAITGQTGVLTRAATGTAVDSNGTTYTAAHSMPRWESRDFLNRGTRYELGIRLGGDDLTWDANWRPETGTVFGEFCEEGTRTTANAGLLYVGNDGQTGARLWVDSTGTDYRVTLHNGTTSQSMSLATATPTSGQMFRLGVHLEDDGTNQRARLILEVLATGTETLSAWTPPIARATAWGTGAKLRVNRIGSAGTLGDTWVRQVAWCPGLLTLDDMAARL